MKEDYLNPKIETMRLDELRKLQEEKFFKAT
jgi:phenylacetate-coenzyme A ligase PaaK-like adenylate-forming protein